MAFVQNSALDDENEKQVASQGAVAPNGGNAVHLAPTSGIGSTGPGATTGNGTPSAGGQFATLDKYVNASQGQAQPLANKITGGINESYNALNQGNQSTLGNIGSAVSAGSTPLDQGILTQEAANPVSFASDPNNVSAYQKQLNAQYTGPQNAESDAGYQKQQAAINSAISQGQASTQTEAGRAGLLRGVEKAPTAGVTAVNSAILSKDPNAQGSIENAYKPFANLTSGLSSGAQGIDQNISKAQSDAQTASTTANKQISDQVNGLNSGLTTQAAQDEAARAKYNQDLQAYQQKFNPISTAVANANELSQQYGLKGSIDNPLAPILAQTVNNNVVTPQNLATQDQYNQAAAFQKLLSGFNGSAPAPIIDASTANQAGTGIPQQAFAAPDAKALADQIYGSSNTLLKNNPQQSYQDTLNRKQILPAFFNLNNLLKGIDPNLYQNA